MKSFKQEGGFTMLEVLLALVILSTISVIVWTTFSNTFRMRDRLDTIEEKTQAIRAILNRFSRDISMTFIVKEKKFNTIFVGKEEGNGDSLTFTTFSNRVYDDQKASDQMIVTYYTQPNKSDSTLLDVMRWTYPFIEDDQYWGERRGTPIIEKVKSFKIEYFSNREFRPSWDTQQIDFSGKLPEGVRLTVELENQEVYQEIFTIPLVAALGGNPIKVTATATPSASVTPNASPTPVPPQPADVNGLESN